MDGERVLELARIACAPLAASGDRGDLVQEAAAAILHVSPADDGLAVTVGRRRAIDWLRSTRNDMRPGRRRRAPMLHPDPHTLHRDASTVDHPNPVVELGFTGRDAVIAAHIAAGCTLREAGAAVGVSESRICQIVKGWADRAR